MSTREEKARDAQRRVELSRQQDQREAVAAQQLIDEFMVAATAQGLTPVPLVARTLSGHKVRTNKRGWYLRRNHSLAIGEDGGYYVLTVPGGWLERLRGVNLEPRLPPLRVGAGGRDGETGYLAEFLEWVLAGQVAQSD